MDYIIESGAGLNLENLLPHDHPMILISGVDSYDKNLRMVKCYVDIDERSYFYDPNIKGVPSYLSLEYMAQTIASLAGIYTWSQGLEPLKGFVLGTRKMNLAVSRLVPGRYEIVCEELFFDNKFGSFDCRLSSNGEELGSSILNAYKVEDMDKFIKDNNLG